MSKLKGTLYLLIIITGGFALAVFFPEIHYLHNQWIEVRESIGFPSFIIGLILYTLLLAIPFVPGIELAIILLLLFGTKWVFFIYLATIVGLSLSFYLGRKLKESKTVNTDNWVFLKQLNPESHTQNLANQTSFWRKILGYPVLTLAVLLNMPFNSALGGGGGIAFGYGFASGCSLKTFLTGVSLAALPFPITISLGAFDFICKFLGIS